MPPEFQAKLGVSGQEKWTDNSYLTATDHRSDFITSVDPNVSLSERTRKLDLGLNYDLGYDQYINDSGLSGFRHNGLAVMDAEVLDQIFFIDARGSVSEQPVNPSAPSTAGTRTSAGNTSLVSTYSVTPKFQERLGRWALAQLSYTHDQTFSAANTYGNTTDTALTTAAAKNNNAVDDKGKLELHSGEEFSRFLWDYSAEKSLHIGNGSSGSYRQTSHTAQTEYKLTDTWGLLTELGHDDYTGSSIDSSKFSGMFYGAGLHFTPSPALDVRAGDGWRYGGNELYALGTYQFSPQTMLRFSQQAGISTDSQSYAEALNAIQRDATGAYVNPFSGLSANPTAKAFSNTGTVYRTRTSNVVLSHSGDRDSTSLTLQYTEQKPTNSTPVAITTIYGTVLSGYTATGSANVQWTHRLTPDLSGTAMAGVSDVLSADQANAKTTTFNTTFSMSYIFNPTVTGTASFRYQDTWQPISGTIEEKLVTLGLSKTF